MNGSSANMKRIRDFTMIILMTAAIVFIALGNFSASSINAERQSQTSTSICDDDSTCYTTVCSDNQPCLSFPSNVPSSMSTLPVEESVVMEPVQEAPVMQPAEDEVDEGYEDAMPRADDESQSFLNPVSEDDTSNSHEDDGRDQKKGNGETEDHVGDAEHEKLGQDLNGTPEALEIETEYIGTGVFVDYIVELQRGETIKLSFSDCHTECDQPNSIRSVYLVDGDVDDNMIISGNIDDGIKAVFEQTDPDSFQFRVPNGVTGSNTFNKLVIETQQTDEISAFYIQQGVKVSSLM